MTAPIKMAETVTRVDFSDRKQTGRIESFLVGQGASLFHTPAWLRAVESGTGQRACGLIAEKMGTIIGWLPLTEVRSPLFGKALVSSGFGVGGGIIAETDTAVEALGQAAAGFVQDLGFSGVELRGGKIPAGWDSWNNRHVGFTRELASDDEAELQSIPRKARAEVRKGLKNDLTVRIGRSNDDRKAHYAVYSESVRNLGTPVFPKKLFNAMLDALPESSDILTVFAGGKPISSVLSFYHNGAVLPYWGGGVFAARNARANELMYYKLMLHAREQGMDSFDFGRSKTGSGPYKFKKNWGFDPKPLCYSKWTAPGEQSRDIDPTSDGYSRKIELWKKLPLPVANLVGPWIARGLA
ncbi:MAG: FemAB family XrtA/PEP-CTERM system-associated protein [Erythrobacter sp.]